MNPTALIYGATGYTGRLIAEMAVAGGMQPVLAGRNQAGVEALAAKLGLSSRSFALDDETTIRTGLDGISVVLHCAGPFSRTSEPMASACLASGVHYLDITGEISVFESLAARDSVARAAGVMLLPGVGFDVVPSDCLAAHLARRLPGARRLLLGIQGSGRLSHGTQTTVIENQDRGGMIRRAGVLTPVPAAWRSRSIDFGRGPRLAVTIPWGDVATAWHSTGIPDIEVYAQVPPALRLGMIASRHLGWLLRRRWVREFQLRRVKAGPAGPSPAELASGHCAVWGRVEHADGRHAESRLQGPNGYQLTALAALAAVRKVLGGGAPPGFQTPSRAYGPDFVLQLDGITREDIS
ncbi:MAG: trans-acting enoyl reductase family protein [Gemmatimonadales bacterium]